MSDARTEAKPLTLMCGLAVRAAFDAAVVPDFEAAGHSVSITWQPTTLIMQNIAAGKRADAVFVVDDAMDTLVAQGVVDPETRVKVIVTRLGLGVLAGRPHPDIASPDGFRDALLNARSVAYSRAGASGIYFNALIERLGIAAAVNAKATVIPSGFTAEKLVTGEADLAVQQISELLVVPGVEVVGPFPAAYQSETVFSAAVCKGAPNRETALAFLRAARGARAAEAYGRTGLELIAAA